MTLKRQPTIFPGSVNSKKRYRATQIKVAISVNTALLEFYWNLGKDISEKYALEASYGSSFFKKLSADLKIAIPDASGLSQRNLRYCLDFFTLYSGYGNVQQVVANLVSSDKSRELRQNLQQVVAKSESELCESLCANAKLIMQVPWGHHIVIMSKCGNDVEKALFYVRKTVENGWSRNVLALEIDGDLYSRQGKAITNFTLTMPDADSDLAQQLTKDPYIFDVQGLAEQYHETELTKAMCENIVRLLNSMGKGFAFVGREYVVEMDGDEYRIDLLFYVIPLHRYFVVEVKNKNFRPEFLGQLQGYVAACDMKLNTPQENPAIGLLVCRGKNAPLAKYLLGKIDMPIGVSDYELLNKVPDDFKSQLPTIEEIEAELANMEKEEGR